MFWILILIVGIPFVAKAIQFSQKAQVEGLKMTIFLRRLLERAFWRRCCIRIYEMFVIAGGRSFPWFSVA